MTFTQAEDAALRAERRGAFDVAAAFWLQAEAHAVSPRVRERCRAMRLECHIASARDAERARDWRRAADEWRAAAMLAFTPAGRARYLAAALTAQLKSVRGVVEGATV